MYIIGSVLISDEVVDEEFACNLSACKGACCWEGDFGAPLTDEELPIMDRITAAVLPRLPEPGRRAIEENGPYHYNAETGDYAVALVNNGPCAFMTLDETGTAMCGIEQAYRDGDIDWKKPISCHLYPIRAVSRPGFEALNYDRWDICSAACARGEREKIRVFEFAEPALVRKYGQAWYDELVAAVGAKK